MASNTRTKNNYGSNSKPKMKGKKIRIDGVNYRMVRRADGRYNLYVEGRAGAVGSTPLIDAKDYSEARKKIKEATKDFQRMEAEANAVSAAEDGVVTVDDYDASTEALVPVEEYNTEVAVPESTGGEISPLDDLDNDGVVDYKRASGADVARARVAATASRATLLTVSGNKKANSWIAKKGFDMMNKGLSEVAREKGMVGSLAGKAASGVKSLDSRRKTTERQYDTAFKREDETLRTSRLVEARKANAEAIKAAKAPGYKALEEEKALLEIERERAREAGDGEALARVNASLQEWALRKSKFDKVTPPNIKLPYPKLPRSNVTKGRTAIERRRLNKTLRGMDVDERLALKGRKAAKAA